MSGVRVVRPIDLLFGSRVTSSGFSEGGGTDGTLWSASNNYVVGNRVYTSAHNVYECIADCNNHPLSPELEPDHWVYVSKTNRYKMFDGANSSASSVALISGTVVTKQVVLQPNKRFNAVSCLNMTNVKSVRTRVYKGSVTYYDMTMEVTSPITEPSWYEHFFGFRRYQGEFAVTSLTNVVPFDASIALTFTSKSSFDDEDTSPTMSIGTVIVGKLEEFGIGVSYGAKLGMIDYSKKEKNQWGDIEIVERAFSKTQNWDLTCESAYADGVYYFLTDNRAKPLLWIPFDGFNSVLTYGFIRNAEQTFSYTDSVIFSVQIEGLS